MTTFLAPDGRPRCPWAAASPELLGYHDSEWGFPVVNDIRLFEKISLEGFQSGLSWRTILAKRENFRRAFAGFDFHTVCGFTPNDVERLLQDAGIVRHRGKVEAVINNAGRAIELESQFGSLAAYFWQYEAAPGEVPVPLAASSSETSVRLSRDLKQRGWKFVGPTTMFAFMQAMGLINDHAQGCVVRSAVDAARIKLMTPTRPRTVPAAGPDQTASRSSSS